MLMIGKTTCEDCKHDYEWYYFKPEDSRAYIIPLFSDKESATLASTNKDNTPKSLKSYCPKFECGYPNYFEVDYDNVKIIKE